MREERDARLRVLAFPDVAEFEQARRAFAVRDGTRRDLDRDGRAVAIGDLAIEPQLALAEQLIDDVGVGDERGDHQVPDVIALNADEAAKAGVHRDRLHAGAHRDAFVQHVEQRVEAACFVRGIARAAQKGRHRRRNRAEKRQRERQANHHDNERDGFDGGACGESLRRREQDCGEGEQPGAQPRAERTVRRLRSRAVPQRSRRCHKVLVSAGSCYPRF